MPITFMPLYAIRQTTLQEIFCFNTIEKTTITSMGTNRRAKRLLVLEGDVPVLCTSIRFSGRRTEDHGTGLMTSTARD
jgi:hypothetical protein